MGLGGVASEALWMVGSTKQDLLERKGFSGRAQLDGPALADSHVPGEHGKASKGRPSIKPSGGKEGICREMSAPALSMVAATRVTRSESECTGDAGLCPTALEVLSAHLI